MKIKDGIRFLYKILLISFLYIDCLSSQNLDLSKIEPRDLSKEQTKNHFELDKKKKNNQESNKETDVYRKKIYRFLQTCPLGQYPKVDDPSSCHSSSASVTGYYYDAGTEEFEKCLNSCTTCSNDYNCITCNSAENYFPKVEDSTSCHLSSDLVTGYYYDAPNHKFEKCLISCGTCSNGSSCSSCNNSRNYYAKIDNPTSCNLDTSDVSGYYFDMMDDIFKTCDPSCQNCADRASSCTECNTEYYQLRNDPSICRRSDNSPIGYYFDFANEVHEQCNISCEECQDNPSFCLRCNSRGHFFPLIDYQNQCYPQPPDGYFFDLPSQVHKRCDVSCAKCTMNPMNCLVCANGFYSVEGTTNPCIHTTRTPEGFFLDHTGPVYLYKRCHPLCKSCVGFPTKNPASHNCWKCINGYFKILNDEFNCYLPPLDYYYLDYSTNILRPCYASCLTCDGEGNSSDHKCTKCKSGYAFVSGKRNCEKGTQLNSYYDSAKGLYLPCYGSCSTCYGSGTSQFHNCATCKNNFFNLEDNKYMCYIKTEIIPNYYFKDLNQYATNTTDNSSSGAYIEKGIFEKCYLSCKSCTRLGNSSENFCLSCRDGYYKSVEGKMNCYPQSREKYYLDFSEELKEKIFYPCYKGCLNCSGAPIPNNHRCTSCDIANKYYISELDNSNCYNLADSPYGYFLSNDKNKYIKCNEIKTSSNATETNQYNSLKIISISPNFIDITTQTEIDIKFSNYLSNTDPKNKITDAYISADLSDGKSIIFGLSLRGYDCNTLHVYFNPPQKIEGFNKRALFEFDKLNNRDSKNYLSNFYDFETQNNTIFSYIDLNQNKNSTMTHSYRNSTQFNEMRFLTNDFINNVGKFKLIIINAQNESISTASTSLNMIISETKIPSFLTNAVVDIPTTFQNYILSKKITQNLISKNKKNQTIQVFNASDDSVAFAKTLAYENMLSFYNFDSCLGKIIDYYNTEYKRLNSTVQLTKENILILKIDDYPKIINPFSKYFGYRTRIFFYNSKSISKEQIDMNICYEDMIKAFIPVSPNFPLYSPVNITKASIYNYSFKADIYNQNDDIYNNICFKFFDNETDLTVNDRRNEIFPNISISCSEGCTFSELDPQLGYSICLCQPSVISNLMLNFFDQTLDNKALSNLYLFSCPLTIFRGDSLNNNFGFIFSIIILFFMVITYTLVEKFLNKIPKLNTTNNETDNNNLSFKISDKKEDLVEEDNIGNKNSLNNEKYQKLPNEFGKNVAIDEDKLKKIDNKGTEKLEFNQQIKTEHNNKFTNYIDNIMFYKKILESDGVNFHPIDLKSKNKILKEFDNNQSKNGRPIDDSLNIIKEYTYQNNDLNNLKEKNKKFKLKVVFNKIKNKNEDGKKNKISYILKRNKKKNIKIKARFIKKERIIENEVLCAEPSFFDGGINSIIQENDPSHHSERNELIENKSKSSHKNIKNLTYIHNSIGFENNTLMNLNANNNVHGYTEQNKLSSNLKNNYNSENRNFEDISLINIQDRTEYLAKNNLENSKFFNMKEKCNELSIDKNSIYTKNPFMIHSMNRSSNYHNTFNNKNKITETLGNLRFYDTEFYTNKKFSLLEYSIMDFYDKLELDKRSFKTRLIDVLRSENLIVSVFFRKSLIIPLSLRIFILILILLCDFAINSLLITIDFISSIHKYKKDVAQSIMEYFPFILVTALINSIFSSQMKKLINPNLKHQTELGKSLTCRNFSKLNEDYKIFLNVSKARRYLTLGLVISLAMIFFYLITCFCGVYVKMQKLFFLIGLTTFLIRVAIIDVIFSLIKAGTLHLSLKYKSKSLYILYKYIQYMN